MAKNSERAHNRAKHNVGTWSRPKEMSAAQDDAQTAWRRDYFRNARPDLDPQSTTSKVMEFFGADTPYAQNAQSYDYRQKAWDDSVKSGNPDLSWSLPALDSFKFWGDEVDGRIPTQAEASAAFEDAMGHGATPEELEAARYAMADPRTRNEKNAAALLSGLNWPALGGADEALAGTMSLLGRGSYEDELALARGLQDETESRDWSGGLPNSPREVVANVGGILGGGATAIPFLKGAKGLTRKVLGPTPDTIIGRAADRMTTGAVGSAGLLGTYGFNEGRGFSDRVANGAGGAMVGGILGGIVSPALVSAPVAITKGAYRKSKDIAQQVAKRMSRGQPAQATSRTPHDAPTPKPDQKPKPRATPQEPGDVRRDIEQAFRRNRRK